MLAKKLNIDQITFFYDISLIRTYFERHGWESNQ